MSKDRGTYPTSESSWCGPSIYAEDKPSVPGCPQLRVHSAHIQANHAQPYTITGTHRAPGFQVVLGAMFPPTYCLPITMSSTVDVLPNLFTAANGKPKCTQGSQFRSWLASRSIQDQDMYLSPGAQRSLSWGNAALALEITAESGIELMKLLWALEPYRITAMLCLEVIRGIFPAMRCYSQALLIDEVRNSIEASFYSQAKFPMKQLQSLIMSGNFTWLRVLRLLSIELIRRISESLLDTLMYIFLFLA